MCSKRKGTKKDEGLVAIHWLPPCGFFARNSTINRPARRYFSFQGRRRCWEEMKTIHLILSRLGELHEDILGCMDHAFDSVENLLADVFHKERFWQNCTDITLNNRQRVVVTKLLNGFDGKLTSSKWAKLAKCSQDTASRDIEDLIAHGILIKNPAGGRSTSYSLVEESTLDARERRPT